MPFHFNAPVTPKAEALRPAAGGRTGTSLLEQCSNLSEEPGSIFLLSDTRIILQQCIIRTVQNGISRKAIRKEKFTAIKKKKGKNKNLNNQTSSRHIMM